MQAVHPKTMLSARSNLVWARGVDMIGVRQTGHEARVIADLAQ